jgi:NAD(P)-dependent dehydrogenase (short-subunit alcohol dehydrogenase family)
MRFDGKAIVILGGSAGIGAEAARGFAHEGGRLAVTGRNADALDALAHETQAHVVVADIADVCVMRATLDELAVVMGGFDILVVNAGIGGFAKVSDISEPFWDEIHNVNLRGAFFAMQAALPHLRDGGSVVVTGSIGSIAAVEGNAAYAAAKAGLRAATRIIGKELLPRNIRVNMVSPGPTDTEIFKRDATPQVIEDMRSLLSSVVPVGRMGRADEVANAILFLASDAASFINGVDLFVDGGCIEL